MSHYHSGVDVCGQPGSTALPCFRSVLLTMLAMGTFAAVVVKLTRLHRAHLLEPTFLCIFYLAALECVLNTLHWSYFQTIVLHFLALFLHIIQFVCVCYFYSGLTLKVFRRRDLINWVVWPATLLMAAYFLAVLIFAIMTIVPNSVECFQSHWLLISGSEIALALVLFVAGGFLTRMMNAVPLGEQSYATWKKRTLWILIVTFFVAAMFDFCLDLTFHLSNETNCDQLFGDDHNGGYTAYLIVSRIMTFLVPIWAMLVLLKSGNKRTTMPLLSEDSEQTSYFKPMQPSSSNSTNYGDYRAFRDDDDEDDLRSRVSSAVSSGQRSQRHY